MNDEVKSKHSGRRKAEDEDGQADGLDRHLTSHELTKSPRSSPRLCEYSEL